MMATVKIVRMHSRKATFIEHLLSTKYSDEHFTYFSCLLSPCEVAAIIVLFPDKKAEG